MPGSAPPRSRALTRSEYRSRDSAIWAVLAVLGAGTGHVAAVITGVPELAGLLEVAGLVLGAGPVADAATQWLLGPRP